MVSKVNCCAITGTEVLPICVETDVCSGLPSFDMVGLLSSEIKESRERVRTAIKNSGFMIPPRRITINLAPADIRKSGTYFDLPISASILKALDIVKQDVSKFRIAGELSLNGDVIKVNGILPMVLMAVSKEIKVCIIPEENYGECVAIEGIEIIGVKNLAELVYVLDMNPDELSEEILRQKANFEEKKIQEEIEESYDFADICGQEQGKIGAMIAAAGRHNMLMVGPPGAGKTVIARTIPTILPDMTFEERIQISKIHSIAGKLDGRLVDKRPFCSPHHTTTVTGMTGGGMKPKVGQVTLAHGGVLYLDEFPEFSRNVIEALRQPLEDKKIVLSRNSGSYEFPADVILIASMNPCKCGYYPDRNRCSCTQREVNKYLSKISGPILDRFDLCVYLNRVEYKDIKKSEKTSEKMKERVIAAAQIQRERYKNETVSYNGQLDGRNIKEFCKLNKPEEELMEQIFNKFKLSMRAYGKVLKVARTIADLDERKNVSKGDISKALTFRTPAWMK